MEACPRAEAVSLAEGVVAAARGDAEEQHLPLPLRLSYGIADFEPGGLAEAVARADEGLYERRGVLLRGATGGRIVLLPAGGGRRLMRPGQDGPGSPPGAFSAGFGPEFDGYFRQMFARAVQQAREFVDFIRPPAGAAVVEVGAGSGRIAFDGGLANRIGQAGQLLLTDPSAPQLEVARRRAFELGHSWVRLLVAPVEELPLASSTVDLVLGSTFLHFTDAPAALRSMARLARPGGRVAIHALLRSGWGPAWEVALAPVRDALAAAGLPFRDHLLPREELEALFAQAGLHIEGMDVGAEERVEFPNVDVAVGVIRQSRIVPRLLQGLPDARLPALQAAFEARFREAVGSLGLRAGDFTTPSISLLARRPE